MIEQNDKEVSDEGVKAEAVTVANDSNEVSGDIEVVAEEVKNTTGNKKVVFAIGMVAVGIILIYLAGVVFFYGRFTPNTIIYGINATAKTPESIETEITNKVSEFSVEIVGKDGQVGQISAMDIDLTLDLKDSVQNIFSNESPYTWFSNLFVANKVDTLDGSIYNYDEEKLLECIGAMTFFNPDYLDASLNARFEYSTGEVEVIPEYYGNYVDYDKLVAVLEEEILKGTESIDIEAVDCYIKPEYTIETEKFKSTGDTLNKYLNAVINYEFGDNSEVVDRDKIKDWLVVTEDFDVYFDREKVSDFVNYIGKTYNTFGNTREFKTAYGDTVSVVGGYYGWRLNREAEIDGLVSDIKNGETILREPVYYQTAVNFGNNDIGDTYAEVDLTSQKMFMTVDGVKVLESDIVTGKPSTGHHTPQGTYCITYKQKKATLMGDDYETEVAFWMPFNYDIGFHDATWQKSFGGKRYLTHGSHGCVNLPLDVAKSLYSYVYKGMPVVCYYRQAPESTTQTTLCESTTEATTKAVIATTTEVTTKNTTVATTQATTESSFVTTEETTVTTTTIGPTSAVEQN